MHEDIIYKLKNTPGEMIKYAITDTDGILRAKYVHKSKLITALESNKGIGFCDVIFGWDSQDQVYDNNTFTGWQTGFPDVPVFIDETTLRAVPWENNIPFFLADLNETHAVCPRSLLKSQVRKAQEMGYEPYFSQEFEWFNFHKTDGQLVPMSEGMFGYSQIRTAQHTEYCQELFEQLSSFDVTLEGLHTETGPGVYEAAIAYTDALNAADRAVLFKAATKKISFEYDFMASFMAKWNTGYPGCSGHIHQNLMSGQKNFFSDPKDEHGMSQLMKHYLAGQLAVLPELMPMLLPTINSYKRLIEGSWAPVNMTWGVENRTTAFRIINMNAAHTRLETRIPGADTNPYLVMAACLAAGLFGIRNKLELNDVATVGNAYDNKRAKSIPKSLREATAIMKNSKVARELFGNDFVDFYVNSRELECKAFEQSVTDWELKRYGEII